MAVEPNFMRDFTQTALWAGAGHDTIEAALRCQRPRLVVSGRLASGKDTVAEAAMHAVGHPDAVRVSFATALRRELDELIEAIRLNGPSNAASVVATTGGITESGAARTAELLCAALLADPMVHSKLRTREIRLALQEWGTEVRRASDHGYWVKRSMSEIVELMAADKAVYVTDARFINEVDPARKLGFLAVRLEVTAPVRAARLRARDGLELDPVAEQHPSEMELEAFQGFDIWVDNSGPLNESTIQVARALEERFQLHS